MPDNDCDRVTPGDLEVIATLVGEGDHVDVARQFRRAAATVRALEAERDAARAELAAIRERATDGLADLERRVANANRAASERAEQVAAAKAAIEAWGCAWREQTERPTLEAWPPMRARAVSVDRPRGHIANADDWRQLAKKLIGMEAAPYRERVEGAGYTLQLHLAHPAGDVPVQVWHYDEAAMASRRMANFGEPGGCPTPDDCEAAAQWAEAQAAEQPTLNPTPCNDCPPPARAPGCGQTCPHGRGDAPAERGRGRPGSTADRLELSAKLNTVQALADELALPDGLGAAMRSRMRQGHYVHRGQDFWALDHRAEARGELEDCCCYVAGRFAWGEATPDDLQAAHLAAAAWALLGGDAAGAEATPEPAQART